MKYCYLQQEPKREESTDTKTAINLKYVLTLTSACHVIQCQDGGKRKTVTRTQLTKLCFVRLLYALILPIIGAKK
jgi:hypothetical protein